MSFNLLGEVAMLLVDIVLLCMMLTTHPRKTVNFQYDFLGALVSMPTCLLMICILVITNRANGDGLMLLPALMVFHTVLYNGILLDLFLYIYFFPLETRKNSATSRLAAKLIMLAMDIAGVILVLRLSCETVGESVSAVRQFLKMESIFGCSTVTLVFLYIILMHRHLIRLIAHGVISVIPLEYAFLIQQYLYPRIISLSITYVIPFLLFYLFFHSNPYDELTGCQNTFSMESRFESNLQTEREFYFGYAIIQELSRSTMAGGDAIRIGTITKICMKIEHLSSRIHLYRQGNGTFNFFLEMPKSEDAEFLIHRMADAIEEGLAKTTQDMPLHIQMIAFYVYPEMKNIRMARAFMNDILSHFPDRKETIRYLAKRDDFEIFQKRYEVSEALNDIRDKQDPNDPRVLCYTQPIYDVNRKQFRTAEALMRISLNGQLVSPAVFIPIAESTNCVHTLTIIMLHKVCQAISKIEKLREFDAITLNCSAKEFSLPKFAEELLNIIRSYSVEPAKIRLELTESAILENAVNVQGNMKTLEKNGIQFYLDDFGTGYSSMERIISFPFRTIKFDKSMLYHSLEDNRMDDITTYMIRVLKKNGFVTLIEGVESDRENSYSIERGFDYIQGFRYARPVPVSELTSYFPRIDASADRVRENAASAMSTMEEIQQIMNKVRESIEQVNRAMNRMKPKDADTA